jgi:hypothetical protein
VNNFITSSDIMPSTIHRTGPGATTTALAGEVPLEQKVADEVPGAFPETPAAVDSSANAFSVNPIPATAGEGNPIQLAPGEPVPHHSTLTDNTISSTARDDEELKQADLGSQTVSAAVLPAFPGAGNPVSVAAGEPLPPHSTVTDHTLTSNVKLDKESYDAPAAVPSFTQGASSIDRDAATATAAHGLGTTNIIPESSIGTGNDAPSGLPTIHSVGSPSTTNDLAGQQPIEPRQEAYVTDNATAAPPSSTSSGGILGAISGGVAGIGAAAAGAAVYLNEKSKETTGVDAISKLPESTQANIKDLKEQNDGTSGAAATSTSTAVPTEVTDSQKVAHVDPEAAANPAAVSEKSAVEKELLAKVPTADAAAVSTTGSAATAVPAPVLSSQNKAHADPEAAANPVAVGEKSAVEQELLKKVHTAQEAGEPAPTVTAATSEVAPTSTATIIGGGTQTVASTTLATSPDAAPAITTTTNTAAPVTEHVGIAPNVSAHGAPQLGQVGPIAPIVLDAPAAADSADVSPLTTPTASTAQTAASAAMAGKTTSTPRPRTSTNNSGTPNKRQSIIERFRGTPEKKDATSPPLVEGEASTDVGASATKKKGFFSKIKEKLSK